MDLTHSQISRASISILIFVFIICGMAGVFCPMPSTASETEHSQPTSHHSTSNNGDCPDQLKSSEEESRPLSFAILHVVELENLGSCTDLFKSSLPKIFTKEGWLKPSSYPPPFLLFSSLLN